MPQDQDALEKELRRQMREGRAPLIQTVRETYELFLAAKKGWYGPVGWPPPRE